MATANSHPGLVTVANPESLRWQWWSAAALRAGAQLELVPWHVLAETDGDLGAFVSNAPAILRIDAPDGDAPNALKAIVDAGARALGTRADAPNTPGCVYYPKLRAAGMAEILDGIERTLSLRPTLVPTNTPAAIAAMSDKPTTAERLRQAKIRCPEGFVGRPGVDILAEVRARGWRWAYMKLRSGACATGIIRLDAELARGLSTIARRGPYFVGVRNLALLEGTALTEAIDFLIAEGAWVERAIDHARVGFDYLDIRVVVIDGAARFTIPRLSRYPITNLTLAGRRGDPIEIERMVGSRAWRDGLELAEAAARLFSARSVGVDVLIDLVGTPWIIELNPFGDFFPRLEDSSRRGIFDLELALWLGESSMSTKV